MTMILGVYPINSIQNLDLFTLCDGLPDQSVDMILCDLPYQITALKWDVIIPFEPMWERFKRVIKPRGAIVLTASQPFTSALVMSNPKMFRHEWIWQKDRPSNIFNAERHPLKYHESILVFSEGEYTYNPQMRMRHAENKRRNRTRINHSNHFGDHALQVSRGMADTTYPSSILEHNRPQNPLHPTQKPVALFRYLIRTYTQPNEIVADFCCGSGTTALAARAEGRNFMCGDNGIDEKTGQPWALVSQERLRLPFEAHYVTTESDFSGLPLFETL